MDWTLGHQLSVCRPLIPRPHLLHTPTLSPSPHTPNPHLLHIHPPSPYTSTPSLSPHTHTLTFSTHSHLLHTPIPHPPTFSTHSALHLRPHPPLHLLCLIFAASPKSATIAFIRPSWSLWTRQFCARENRKNNYTARYFWISHATAMSVLPSTLPRPPGVGG